MNPTMLDVAALLTRLTTNGRTWVQMRNDEVMAAQVIRLLMQQNAELAVRSMEIVKAAEEMAAGQNTPTLAKG